MFLQLLTHTLCFTLVSSLLAVFLGTVVAIINTYGLWNFKKGFFSFLGEIISEIFLKFFEMTPLIPIFMILWGVIIPNSSDIQKSFYGGIIAGTIWSANVGDWVISFIKNTYTIEIYPSQLVLWGIPTWLVLIKYVIKRISKSILLLLWGTIILALITETNLWIIGEFLQGLFPINMYKGLSYYIKISNRALNINDWGSVSIVILIVFLSFLTQLINVFMSKTIFGRVNISIYNKTDENKNKVLNITETIIKSNKGNFELFINEFPVFSKVLHFLFGPSGSGKSIFFKTLLNMLPKNFSANGDVFAYTKKINFLHDISTYSIYLPQEPALYLYPYFRIEKIFKVKYNRDEGQLCDDILDLKYKRPWELSAGQKRKVAACIFFNDIISSHNENFLFLDEPDASLDLVSQWEFFRKLSNIMQSNVLSAIYITHNTYLYNFATSLKKRSFRIDAQEQTVKIQELSRIKNLSNKADLFPEFLTPLKETTPILEFNINKIKLPSGKLLTEYSRDLKNKEVKINLGEIVVIAGRNGRGKSSLIKSIVGIYKGYGNAFIYIENKRRNLIGLHPSKIAKYKIFVMFEDVERLLPSDIPVGKILSDIFYFKLSKYKFVSYILKKLLNSKSRILKETFKDFDFNKTITEYSGGQRQKLLIKIMELMNPSLVIIDEPFSRLDQETLLGIFSDLLKKLSTKKLGILMVTHNLILVNKLRNSGYPIRTEFLWKKDETELKKVIKKYEELIYEGGIKNV